MANIRLLKQSFSGGEITPELYGRIELPKYQSGVASCRNFIVLPHGPVANRPGTKYILQARDSTKKVRLIPFSFSTTQTYALEFGHNYIRFHTNGGTLLEASQNITGITKANPGILTYFGADPTNGDWMFMTGIGGMTQLNGRYVRVANVNAGANTFELQDTNGNNINTTAFGTYTSGGTMARVYTLTTTYAESDLFDLHFVQSADVLTIVHPSYAPAELRRLSATSWSLTNITFGPTITAPTGVSVTPTGTGSVTYRYVVTAISSITMDESVASSQVSTTNNLTTVGNKNTVSWTAVSGAIRYNVYRGENGLDGYIGQTASTSFVDDNFNPDTTVTPPELKTPFNAANKYPSAVTYFEQRRVFGGTNNNPQTFWMTRSGTESNLNFSIPSQDSDGIEATVASREVQRIRHFVPLADLLFLTPSGEWRVGATTDAALTPTTLSVKPQSYIGASNVQPVVTGNSVLYVQDRGSHIREMAFEWQSSVYKTSDVSIMAPHLVDNFTIPDIAYARSPYQIMWSVRNDGVLLGMTYVPEHQVISWHKHDTAGTFESVCAIAEGNEDAVYVVVRRTVNGNTLRYIERFSQRYFATKEDAFFVDSGLTYSGTATTTITGLWHLEGATVSVLADGAVYPQRVVANGSITLNEAASKVHVGLPITADIETLPVAVTQGTPDGGQGHVKNINRVWLRMNRSSGIFVGPDEDHLTEYKQRTTEPYGSAPDLVSDEIEIVLSPMWGRSGKLVIRQSDPLPITLVSMVSEAVIGG